MSTVKNFGFVNWSVGIRKPGSKVLDTGGFEGMKQKKWKIFASSLFL